MTDNDITSTIKRLRSHSGWWAGDASGEKVLAEFRSRAVEEATKELREQIAAAESFPAELLDVHAICDQRDRLKAELDALRAEVEALREDKALLDAFDLAGRQDDVQTHQISEDECEPELLGHFWVTPTVQSISCREGLGAALRAARKETT